MRYYNFHNTGRYIGFYYGVAPVLSKYPEGDSGDYFLNGETLSFWMWDSASRMWIDTNRIDSGLQQMLTDEAGNSPSDYVPSPSVGIKEAYFYVAENADCDEDESASPRDITFTNFKNGNSSVSVQVRKTSIVILYWNGDYWETSVVPMNVDLSRYLKATDDDKKNWNDTAERLRNFLESIDASDEAITTWKEIENFLQGVTDTDTLTGLLLEQETRINSTIEEEKVRAQGAEQNLSAVKADKVTMAHEGNLAAFDTTGNLQDSGIDKSNVEIHTDTMPVASAANEGRIYLYTGADENSGTFYTGNKYICRAYDGGYRWEPLYGYVIADSIKTAGSGLPDGTVMFPLNNSEINGIVYNGGTPYKVVSSGWYVWFADTGKISVTYTLPAASAEYREMTFISTGAVDDTYPPGIYQCVKNGEEYSWQKTSLLSDENFTAEDKLGIQTLKSDLTQESARASAAESELQETLNSEISRAKAAERKNSEDISAERDRAMAAEQVNADAISAEVLRATVIEQANAEAVLAEKERAMAAEKVLSNDINTLSGTRPSISDMDISKIDSLGNTAPSNTYIVTDGLKKGFMLFENTGNNAQRQTLYMENVLKYRTRDAGGWSEWNTLADFSDGLAAVATSGSYNDLKNRPSLSSVATSGNYESLSNKPLQGSISFDAADSLCQSYQNGVYIITAGGLTQGLLSFSTVGNGGLQQYLLQDGTIKSRSGSYMGSGTPAWNEWQTADFGISDYNDLLNQPVQIIESESYLDNLNYSNTSGIYVVKSGYGATLYICTTTSSSTYIQIKMGLLGIAYRNGYFTETLGNKNWTTFVHYPYDWDSTYNSQYPSDLNNFTEEGIYFVKGTNDKATNLPITNTGETINVAFTLLVSVSKPITLENGTERAIVGQQLTLANRIGSENKQYLRHAIADTKNGETTYTWGVWREAVTQTMLGNGGICTDAEIDAAIDNGIYSGVASESGILPQYSTFTMVVVNNYAATAAASAMGVPSDWRQVTQTIITVPLSTDGQQNDGVVYMRTGIGGSTIAWGELKQVGGEEPTLYIAEPQTEQVWDLKNHPNWGCPVSMDIHSAVVYIKLDETINHPYQKEYHFILTGASSGTVAFHIDTEKEFEFKKLVKSSNNDFPNVSTDLQDTKLGMYTVAPATLKVYFTGNKYYVYFDY